MRECGECTACCTALDIHVLNKPAYTRCKHVTAKGCSIYEDRPKTPCQTFRCAWLDGYLEEEDRPDLSGAIVWQTGINGSRQTLISVLKGREPEPRLVDWVRRNATSVIVEREGFRREVL